METGYHLSAAHYVRDTAGVKINDAMTYCRKVYDEYVKEKAIEKAIEHENGKI